ncbi:MAG: hypothetical protein HWN66_16890 [Candidatus Helarchaeota archaeon]|nr:hypothetical protein [Candidatus Helarchaeota archaeon]
MPDRKPTWLRLPCTRCANEIPELIEGVTLRCLMCGADNTFYESRRFLEKKAKEMFGETPSIEFIEDPNKRVNTLNERLSKIQNAFQKMEPDYQEIEKHAIVATPLEKYGVSGRKIMQMVQEYNFLAVLTKNYCLPLPMTVEESTPSQEMFYTCAFRGLIFLGTYHTIEARRATVNTEATRLYDTAARNFAKASDIATQAINAGFGTFRTKKALADAVNNYSTGLASITRGNPDYATRKFKQVRSLLEDIITRESRAKIDHVRVGMIVSLQPSVKMILKQLKDGTKVRETSKVRLYPLDKSKEIIDTVRGAKDWVEKQKERFDGIMDFYKRLNYGEKLDYMKRYNDRFDEFFGSIKVIYDDTVREIVGNLSEEYNFKASQLFRRLESAAKTAVLPGESTREQFEEGRKELEAIDELFKSVMVTLLNSMYSQKGIKSADYTSEADVAIKQAHLTFDDLVRTAVTQLILDYDESTQRIFDRLSPIADSAKLPGEDVVEQFRDSRAELDSLGFTISSLVDVSYTVKRKEFTDRIQAVQKRQRSQFDTIIRRAVINLIGDYGVIGKKIVITAVPVARAAGALGDRALDQMQECKRDIDSTDESLENTISQLLAVGFNVKRTEFHDNIIEAQFNRDRDFVDSVRTAVQSLLTFTAMPRWKMIRIRKDITKKGESAMAKGKYAIAARFFADAAKISQELGEMERAKELEERARGMERLASMIG